jgi:uncharacterized protein YecE (DUF72 family)
MFHAAEGNTTFDHPPWAEAVAPEHFRFRFKFPQVISHESYQSPAHTRLNKKKPFWNKKGWREAYRNWTRK